MDLWFVDFMQGEGTKELPKMLLLFLSELFEISGCAFMLTFGVALLEELRDNNAWVISFLTFSEVNNFTCFIN